MREICYVTGTRADFGLMRRTLGAIDADPDLSLSLVVTGMHLDSVYGSTVNEIRDSALDIRAEVAVPLKLTTGGTMARNIGSMLSAFTDIFEAEPPDLVLLLGDRGEMLAGALAAIHLNIPIAHVHGGELSGTVDESVRHAISKLSHIHFTATEAGRDRLIRMGEDMRHIHAVGAPGLDGLMELEREARDALMVRLGLDPAEDFALLVYHPVLQEADMAGSDAAMLVASLKRAGMQTLAVMPNADAGGAEVRAALDAVRDEPWISVVTHLERSEFIFAMAAADVMIGNSSAGIIEAATFGTPVINIGARQNLRERNANTLDIPCRSDAIDRALTAAVKHGRFAPANIYGDGHATERIVTLLKETPLTRELLMKVNSY